MKADLSPVWRPDEGLDEIAAGDDPDQDGDHRLQRPKAVSFEAEDQECGDTGQ